MSAILNSELSDRGCVAEETRRKRLAVVISHPIQHFVPLFVRLAESTEIELRVFYCCDWGVREYRDPGFGNTFAWDIPLMEGYDSVFLPIRRRPQSLGFFDIDNQEVASHLEAFDPDAVWVHGYAHRTSWRVMRWARSRASVLYFGDSELLSQRGIAARLCKRIILPSFFRRCDGFLTIGDNNEAYYRHYGVAENKLFRGSFPIDLSRFCNAISELTDEDKSRMRGELGLSPDAVVVLFVGKLIGIKRPLDFVDAIAGLTDSVRRVEGLIVGSGPMEEQVSARIQELGLEDRVRMTGFINQAEIPKILFVGDIIAMCSEKDPHPLAVSEAMAAGNAVVASDRVGCVGPTDAARIGRNAAVYPCGDVKALSQQLRRIAEDDDLLRTMQRESLTLAPTQDVQAAATAVIQFMEQIG